MKIAFLYIAVVLYSCSPSMSQVQQEEIKKETCKSSEELYEKRSDELQKIVDEDQADRSGGNLGSDIIERDEARLNRTNEIYLEGCFKSARDYGNAALVFQHGDKSEHFYTAHKWAKKAVELGDSSIMRLIALTADRYLNSLGYKQLFGSQAYKGPNSLCFCLYQIEKSFSKELRKKYLGNSLRDQEAWVDELNANSDCPSPSHCLKELKTPPKGLLEDIW